jgi:site-specific DNA-cytosine methylase
LESEGYTVQPFVVPACALNAPHRRDRVWIIASYADCESQSDVTGHGEEGQWLGCPASDDADANSQRLYRAEQYQQRGGKSADRQERELGSVCEVLAGRGDTAERSAADVGHAKDDGRDRWPAQVRRAGAQDFTNQPEFGVRGKFGRSDKDVADARREGVHESRFSGNAEPKGKQQRRVRPDGLPESANGQRSNVADAKSQRVQGHRPSGEQVAHSHERQGLPLCGDERPATAVRQSQSGVGGVADGVSTWLDEPRDIPRVATGVKQRAARLKGLGNAIVPQIAMQIGLTIKAVENG